MAPKKKREADDAAKKDEPPKKVAVGNVKIPVLKKPLQGEVLQKKPEKVEKKEESDVKGEDNKDEVKQEKVEVKEEEKFKEADAVVDNRPTLKTDIGFATEEMTLNVLPTWGGRVLTTITEGGMAYLLAGARANVGQKAGRYMFEVKIVQCIQTSHAGQKPKQLVRVGFSTSTSSLILGESSDSICFDCDGFFTSETKRAPGGQRFTREQVIAVVLNLDPKSSNYNTITMYKEGLEVMEPKPLPEALKGQTLFPHVTFRNVSVAVNFGPTLMKDLPFQCRILQKSAASDVVVAPSKAPKDGKYEVVLPVAFPDEGTFDWLDMYLERNPHFVELSDRKIIDWAKSSGLWPKGGWKVSNDRPNVSFGVPTVDDFSVRKVIAAIAPVVPRNYLIMEVKSNLMAAERKEVLKKFNYPCYKKVAHIVMGEPADDFKAMVHNKLLKEKQAKPDDNWKKRKAEFEQRKKMKAREKEIKHKRRAQEKLREEQRKKRLAEMRAKEAEKRAKEAEKKAKEAAEKKAKKAEDKAKAAEAKAQAAELKAKEDAEKIAKGETVEETKEEEPAEESEPEAEEEEMEVEEEPKEEPEEEKKAESESEDEPEVDELGTEPPVVELTEDEKKTNFLPRPLPDLTPQVMATCYGKFTTPEKEEGFDEVRFEWEKGEEAFSYLKSWVMNKKRTTRIEDLKPGVYFREKLNDFAQLYTDWQDKHKAWEKARPKAKSDEEPVEKPAHKKADFDIFSVENIMDVNEGEPLFGDFTFEDWALVQLRFELYVLLVSFKKDADDSDRVGIPMDHLTFYYTKYFNKQLVPKVFGVAEIDDIIAMIPDTVASQESVLVSQLAEDLEGIDIFVKLAEEHRRERQRRLDAGDETARLKFLPTAKPVISSFLGKISPGGSGASASGTIAPKVAAPKVAKMGILPSLAAISSLPSVAGKITPVKKVSIAPKKP